eukprot:3099952-Amphidinium_carterae.1
MSSSSHGDGLHDGMSLFLDRPYVAILVGYSDKVQLFDASRFPLEARAYVRGGGQEGREVVFCVSWNRESGEFAVAFYSSLLEVWDSQRCICIAARKRCHKAPVWAVAYGNRKL